VITQGQATVTVDGVAFFQCVRTARRGSMGIQSQPGGSFVLTDNIGSGCMGSMDLTRSCRLARSSPRGLMGCHAPRWRWGLQSQPQCAFQGTYVRRRSPVGGGLGRQMKPSWGGKAPRHVLPAERARKPAICRRRGAPAQGRARYLQARGRREGTQFPATTNAPGVTGFRPRRPRLAKATADGLRTSPRGDVARVQNYSSAEQIHQRRSGSFADRANHEVLMIRWKRWRPAGSLARHPGEDCQGDFGESGGLPPAVPPTALSVPGDSPQPTAPGGGRREEKK